MLFHSPTYPQQSELDKDEAGAGKSLWDSHVGGKDTRAWSMDHLLPRRCTSAGSWSWIKSEHSNPGRGMQGLKGHHDRSLNVHLTTRQMSISASVLF